MLIEEKDNQKQDIVSIKNCFAYHKVINKNGQQEYVFLKANQSFKKLVNLAKKDLTGKKLVDIIDANKLLFNWRKLYNRVLLRDRQLRFTTYISRKDSWYEVVIYKLSNQHLMTTFTNISEIKRSYQQKIIKQKLDKKILNSLKNHIVVINQAGVIEYANKVWKDFARKNNVSPEKVSEGSNYLAAIKKEKNNSAKKIFNQLEAIINGEIDSFQQKYSCHSPNQKSWFKMYAKKIQFFKQRKIVIVHEEITKRELSRQKIRKQAKLRKLINRLSTLFINLSLGEIDQAINYSLKQMGKFIATDRCYIVLFNSEYTSVDNSYLWSKLEGCCLADKLQDISSENYPWLMEKLFDFNKIRITKLEDLPPEAKNLKQLLLKSNVKSVLIV